MCGVIGYTPLPPNSTDGVRMDAQVAFARLLSESRARGTHCFGVARPGYVFRSPDIEEVAADFDPEFPHVAHARYSTSGDWRTLENNQPIVVNDMALALNGVISMGKKEEYEEKYGVTCAVDNDAEIFLRLLERGDDATDLVLRSPWSFAGCWLVGDELWIGRNERRPMWTAREFGGRWFASTRNIFLRAGFHDSMLEVLPGVYRATMPWSKT